MIHKIHLYRLVLLSLTFVGVGCSKKETPQAVQDYNSVRAELRAQVEQGTLTREEAIVQLAEAQAKAKSYARKKKKTHSPELQAYGEELKEKFDQGDMTAEEAKAAWRKAAGTAKSKAGAKKTQDSSEVKK